MVESPRETDPRGERPGLAGVKRAEPADNRNRHIREHRHLQELDVGIADHLQYSDTFAGKDAQRGDSGVICVIKDSGYVQYSVWITPDPREEERQILAGEKSMWNR